jgi:2-polyprenyl-3-methyl-5-hydroxy-6-metoxy-1,4-benzoquinol methylase
MSEVKNCPLCNNDKFQLFYKGVDEYFSKKEVCFLICDNCSLVFLSPRPYEEENKRMYKEVFQDKRRGLENINQAVERLKRIKSYENKTKEIKYFEKYINNNSVCLEIGCGWGTLGKVIQDKFDCFVEGVEPSRLAAITAKEYYGLKVFHGNFDEYYQKNGAKGKYDFIFSYHVIEHIQDQNDFLNKVRDLLSDNGRLLLALPDLTSPDSPYEKFFHVEHCYYYSLNTIRLMLRKNGFEIERYWQCASDMKIVCKKTNYPESMCFKNIEEDKFKKSLARYNRCYNFFRKIKIFFPISIKTKKRLRKLIFSVINKR